MLIGYCVAQTKKLESGEYVLLALSTPFAPMTYSQAQIILEAKHIEYKSLTWGVFELHSLAKVPEETEDGHELPVETVQP